MKKLFFAAIYFSLIASSEAKRNKKDEKLSKTRRNKKIMS